MAILKYMQMYQRKYLDQSRTANIIPDFGVEVGRRIINTFSI